LNICIYESKKNKFGNKIDVLRCKFQYPKCDRKGICTHFRDNDNRLLAIIGFDPKAKSLNRILQMTNNKETYISIRKMQDLNEPIYPHEIYSLIKDESNFSFYSYDDWLLHTTGKLIKWIESDQEDDYDIFIDLQPPTCGWLRVGEKGMTRIDDCPLPEEKEWFCKA